MTKHHEGRILLFGAVLTLTACTELEIQNKPPKAKAQLLANGALVDLDVAMPPPIAFTGAPIAIVLDGTLSSDEDGSVATYLWMATDAPAYERYAGNGRVDSGILPPFAGDPPPVVAPQLSLGEGTYKYSLWVTDDEGLTSDPSTLEFTIGAAPAPAP